MKVKLNDSGKNEYSGTPAEIMEQLRERSFDSGPTLKDFIAQLQERVFGAGLPTDVAVSAQHSLRSAAALESEEAASSAALAAMETAGLIRIVEPF